MSSWLWERWEPRTRPTRDHRSLNLDQVTLGAELVLINSRLGTREHAWVWRGPILCRQRFGYPRSSWWVELRHADGQIKRHSLADMGIAPYVYGLWSDECWNSCNYTIKAA
jgi:hypothetical protein